MEKLNEILEGVKVVSIHGAKEISVSDIQIDSRHIGEGACFVAIKGQTVDGHQYINGAVAKGAKVIVYEESIKDFAPGITYVQVENSAKAAGIIAHNFHGKLTDKKIILVGVTGTNGKTTVATLLFKLFTSLGYHCGLISTVQNQIGDEVLPSERTTPDQITLNNLIADMYLAGCSYVFMEVSSIAIHQNRVAGLNYRGGLFTNITHDHLDYHKTFEEYLRVKKSYFDSLGKNAFAITNADDRRGMVMLQNTVAEKYTYSLKTLADFKGKIIDNSILGLHMDVDGREVQFRLIGAFNAYNLLAVYGAAVCLGQNKDEILEHLSNLTGAEGRFDYQISEVDKIMGIVDYAHTPDALLNVLATIKNLKEGNSKVITVAGCGGDRDHSKRPEMAAVCCDYSDKVILTSDNPRSEEPEAIIKDMEAGVPASAKRKCLSIVDRKEAIKTAVMFAGPRDIILVAGKGHEKYQEIKGVKHHFDDKEELTSVFKLLNK